jgi:hypothetical protein
MRLPEQSAGVSRTMWQGATGGVTASDEFAAARISTGGLGGGGLGSWGGTFCRLGCGAAYAACVAGCAALTGPGAAACAAVCSVLWTECKGSCPSFSGGFGGVVIY